ncbi:unnamed protein product, partial [Lymnaea stagnalis]
GHGIRSDDVFVTFILNVDIVSTLLALAGIAFNLLNVVVFVKLGLSETTNISLLSLALADVVILLTIIGYTVVYNPLTLSAAPNLDILDAVNYVVLGTPHVMFSRIAGCLTAFVALERFLCVAFPLHVKIIVTPGKTTSAVLCINILTVVFTLPTFIANQIGPRLNAQLNLTVVGLIQAPSVAEFEGVTIMFNLIVQMTSFVVVTLSTLGLIRSLHKVTQWRKSSSSSQIPRVSGRDKQLVKMVIMISVAFIVSSFPTLLVNTLQAFVKEFSVRGREKNLFIAVCAVLFNLQTIHSVVNIFIYLSMSTRFKRQLFDIF